MSEEIVAVRKKARKLIKCGCDSAFQDKRYGKGKRLHNFTTKDFFRCTVCGKDNR